MCFVGEKKFVRNSDDTSANPMVLQLLWNFMEHSRNDRRDRSYSGDRAEGQVRLCRAIGRRLCWWGAPQFLRFLIPLVPGDWGRAIAGGNVGHVDLVGGRHADHAATLLVDKRALPSTPVLVQMLLASSPEWGLLPLSKACPIKQVGVQRQYCFGLSALSSESEELRKRSPLRFALRSLLSSSRSLVSGAPRLFSAARARSSRYFFLAMYSAASSSNVRGSAFLSDKRKLS